MFSKILCMLLVLTSANAFAGEGRSGTSAGDGGQGILCRQFTRNTGFEGYSLEVLDLYEGRTLLNGGFGQPKLSASYNLDWVATSAAKRHIRRVQERLARVIGNHHFLNWFEHAYHLDVTVSRDRLPVTYDVGRLQVKAPARCELVQIGVYDKNTKTIMIDIMLAQMLGNRDVAAILLHEALHDYFPQKDSNLVVRQAVMFAFAPEKTQMRNRELILELIEQKRPIDISRLK